MRLASALPGYWTSTMLPNICASAKSSRATAASYCAAICCALASTARWASCSAVGPLGAHAERTLARAAAKKARRITDERLEKPSRAARVRSEEHTSELQSLMRISYAVFCLKTKQYNK